jgi:hypothetical protein
LFVDDGYWVNTPGDGHALHKVVPLLLTWLLSRSGKRS